MVVHRVESLQRAINPARDAIAFWKLLRRMRQGKYDVVHTHISKAGFLGRVAARCAAVPVVVHTYHGRVEELNSGTLRGRVLTACERYAARMSDSLVAVSAEELREKMAAGIGSGDKYRLIHAEIDLHRYQTEKDWSQPAAVVGDPVIGTIGTLTHEKGIDQLIEALPAVMKQHPGLQLCIVGAGPMEMSLRKTAAHVAVDAAVHFAGMVEDVRPCTTIAVGRPGSGSSGSNGHGRRCSGNRCWRHGRGRGRRGQRKAGTGGGDRGACRCAVGGAVRPFGTQGIGGCRHPQSKKLFVGMFGERAGFVITYPCPVPISKTEIEEDGHYVVMSIFAHHFKPYQLYCLLHSVASYSSRGIFLIDVKRDFFNFVRTYCASWFKMGSSADFMDDAILSMRRAYTVAELGWILGRVPGLTNCSVRELESVYLIATGEVE